MYEFSFFQNGWLLQKNYNTLELFEMLKEPDIEIVSLRVRRKNYYIDLTEHAIKYRRYVCTSKESLYENITKTEAYNMDYHMRAIYYQEGEKYEN